MPDDTVTRVDLRTLEFAQRSILAPGTGTAGEADELAALSAAERARLAAERSTAGYPAVEPVRLDEHRARRAG